MSPSIRSRTISSLSAIRRSAADEADSKVSPAAAPSSISWLSVGRFQKSRSACARASGRATAAVAHTTTSPTPTRYQRKRLPWRMDESTPCAAWRHDGIEINPWDNPTEWREQPGGTRGHGAGRGAPTVGAYISLDDAEAEKFRRVPRWHGATKPLA